MATSTRPAARWRPLLDRLEEREVMNASVIAVGADAGGGPRVTLLDSVNGTVVQDFFAYESDFRGGVRVALGDLNADGTARNACRTSLALRRIGRTLEDNPSVNCVVGRACTPDVLDDGDNRPLRSHGR